jgi:hypothetical protein
MSLPLSAAWAAPCSTALSNPAAISSLERKPALANSTLRQKCGRLFSTAHSGDETVSGPEITSCGACSH